MMSNTIELIPVKVFFKTPVFEEAYETSST